uniref:Tumor necrosis factor receptor superfamily member 5 n=1 Tax=Canis lupus familiaris TaxID=9615 RepID=A0A8I3P6H0_CANLF
LSVLFSVASEPQGRGGSALPGPTRPPLRLKRVPKLPGQLDSREYSGELPALRVSRSSALPNEAGHDWSPKTPPISWAGRAGAGAGELLETSPRPYSAACYSPRHGSPASALSLLGLLVDHREKLVNDCLHTIDTECTRCQTGEFLDTWNAERHCHQHKYCDPNLGLHVEKEGTSETDTTCTCDEGLHCTNAACESCTMHSLCPPGLGVKQIATGISDTICDPCPIGFFSNVSSALEKCHPWTSCETKGLVKVQAGTNKTDVICGPQPRLRALVVVPIIMGILLAVLLVSACIRESPGKVVKKPENKVMYQDPVEDLEEFPMPPHSIAPVQETLHGCQPVTQEDGKESRISVQERV